MRSAVCLALILIAPASTLADGNWVDFHKSDAFFCRSEFRLSDRDVARLLQELDELRTAIETNLKVKVQDRSIQLNFFARRRNYVNYIAQRVPEGVKRKALYVQGPDMGRVYAYRSLSFETDVRHEATHALLHNALPFVPLWLDEGLAEFFEVPPGKRIAGNGHLGSMRFAMRLGWKPNLVALEDQSDQRGFKGGDYRESWAWVHFLLLESRQSREILLKYIQDIYQRNPPGPLSKRLRQEMPNAEQRLIIHLKNWAR